MPEVRLLALLLQAIYSIRSERMLVEELMARFLELLMDSLEVKPLLSSELFGERHPAARLDLPSLSGADR